MPQGYMGIGKDVGSSFKYQCWKSCPAKINRVHPHPEAVFIYELIQ